MGTARSYDLSGQNGVHFTRFEWDTYDVLDDGTPVIYKKGTTTASAPTLSNCHNTYAVANGKTKKIDKIVRYNEQAHTIKTEIHWTHKHKEHEKGSVHVHYDESDRELTRLPNKEELQLYEYAMEYNKRLKI